MGGGGSRDFKAQGHKSLGRKSENGKGPPWAQQRELELHRRFCPHQRDLAPVVFLFCFLNESIGRAQM